MQKTRRKSERLWRTFVNQHRKDDKAQTGKYITRNEEKEMADIKITSEDIQAVMVEDPRVSLQVQVKALTRTLQSTEMALEASVGEVTRLTQELDGLKNGKNAKEK